MMDKTEIITTATQGASVGLYQILANPLTLAIVIASMSIGALLTILWLKKYNGIILNKDTLDEVITKVIHDVVIKELQKLSMSNREVASEIKDNNNLMRNHTQMLANGMTQIATMNVKARTKEANSKEVNHV